MRRLFHAIELRRHSPYLFWKMMIAAKDMLWWLYVVSSCSLSKMALHPLWYLAAPKPHHIQPVIVACDKNLALLETFIGSYVQYTTSLPPPIIFADTFGNNLNPKFLALLQQLQPAAIIPIEKMRNDRKENIEHFFTHRLFVLISPQVRDLTLLLEDDIIFSSKFPLIIHRLSFKKNTGCVTIYSPLHEYFPMKTNGLLHTIRHEYFYGAQALIFSKKAVEVISRHSKDIPMRSDWHDHAWANLLKAHDYTIMATNNSYVQHVGQVSRLRADNTFHQSYKFIA